MRLVTGIVAPRAGLHGALVFPSPFLVSISGSLFDRACQPVSQSVGYSLPYFVGDHLYHISSSTQLPDVLRTGPGFHLDRKQY